MDGSPRSVEGREGDLDADAVRRRAVATGLVEGAHMVGVAQAAQDETVGEFRALHRLDDDALAAILGAVDVITADLAFGFPPSEPHLALVEFRGKSGAAVAPARSRTRHILARRLDHALGRSEER